MKIIPPMTCAQFFEALLEKYVPHSMRKCLWDELIDLQQGLMSLSLYEMWFYELDRHVFMIMPIKHERVYRFFKGNDKRPHHQDGFNGS